MIAFLSDFGLKDGYVSSVKAVIKSIDPKTEIIDISHSISPQNISEGAYVLWSVYKYFPKGTIFLSVIDPGVGSDREIIILKSNDYIFIAPNNGLLEYVICEENIYSATKVTNKKYFSKNVSSTFHGRDIFAPIAAYLSKGKKIKKFGDEIIINSKNVFIDIEKENGAIIGKIIYIDHYGNLITNLKLERSIDLSLKMQNVIINKLSKSYFESKKDEPIAYIGSTNLIEIGISNKNAAKVLKIKVGTEVDINKN